MSLSMPPLDDRTYDDLVMAALDRIRATSGDAWNDLSPHDPGRVLLEAFAYLSETMLYRLNRLPAHAYVALLNLLGVEQRPPYAATVDLRFERAESGSEPLLVPKGTKVSTERGRADEAPPIFVVATDERLAAGEDRLVRAYHAQHEPWRFLQESSGEAGQGLSLPHGNLVGNDALEVRVAVELETGAEGEDVIDIDDRPCQVWREKKRFEPWGHAQARVFEVDRLEGRLRFAPAIQPREDSGAVSPVARPMAAVPPRGRRIYAEYWWGGGPDGNVARNLVVKIKGSLSGAKGVTNPEAAAGGRDAEPLENTLKRAPIEVFSLDRAVTRLDYEIIAGRVGGVSRARAFTGVELWPHERPGSVVVVLVPDGKLVLGQDMEAQLRSWQQGDGGAVLQAVQAQLVDRHPLGTTVHVGWGRYKRVQVQAQVVVHPSEDKDRVKRQVLERLYRTISPLPDGDWAWAFGRALRISDVYQMLLSDPAVRYADKVRLVVDEVPDGRVNCVAADPHLPGLWYAGSQGRLLRSQNDGDSWEDVGLARALSHFEDLQSATTRAVAVHPHPEHAGLVAVAINATRPQGPLGVVLVSDNTAENWWLFQTWPGFEVRDIAWIRRGGRPVLLTGLAPGPGAASDTRKVGLYAQTWGIRGGADWIPIGQAGQDGQIGVESISTLAMPNDVTLVAVAEGLDYGPDADVHLATVLPIPAGASGLQPFEGTFVPLGLAEQSRNRQYRVVHLQRILSRVFLWVGRAFDASPANDNGVMQVELRVGRDERWGAGGRWQSHGANYQGGSVNDLALVGHEVWAGTNAGVLKTSVSDGRQPWTGYGVDEGLLLRADARGPAPVQAVAARIHASSEAEADHTVVMAGTTMGLARWTSDTARFQTLAEREVETVSLPPQGLFCSKDHNIEVTHAPQEH